MRSTGWFLVPHLLACCVSGLKEVQHQSSSFRRPFYLFGHMANTPSEVKMALSSGANAVEADVQFGINGQPLRLYHGLPCDCFRDCFSSASLPTYLSYLRTLSTPGDAQFDDRLVLIYFDLKLDSVAPEFLSDAGMRFAIALIIHYFKEGKVPVKAKVVIGIPRVGHASAFRGFIKTFYRFINTFHYTQYFFLRSIGYDVSNQQQDLGSIQRMLEGLHLQHSSWQGDGISNCLPRSDHRLRLALRLRDFGGGHANKVYAWTIDSTSSIENALRLDVDGIMTNDVLNLASVLSQPEFKKRYRLATHDDDPWKRIRGQGPKRAGCEQDTCWRDCNFSGDWCWTSVTRCQTKPQMCNLSLACHGTCGQRFKGLLFSFWG